MKKLVNKKKKQKSKLFSHIRVVARQLWQSPEPIDLEEALVAPLGTDQNCNLVLEVCVDLEL